MYEDHTIEEKYLYNFSSKERKELHLQHKKWALRMAKYQDKVYEFIFSDSPVIFGDWGPQSNTFLEIKYVLNRITANDPRDTSFELGSMDSVQNADKLALDIAQAFHNNTICKKVILNEIGLTDNGALPILHTLKMKQLYLLDIGDNNLTGKTIQVLDSILSSPETKWGKVNLGSIQVNPEQKSVLEKHKNLSFVPMIPPPTIGTVLRNLWQNSRV